ncbi:MULTISPECIES: GNAT family N-acetyltransferase [Rhodonellum]|uniref:Protein N-acetyltransferase, RimJ/RimL family n=1 Tax=Rhodonellum ikkaensis TaxID=336829 RepID=A0A1H3R5E3_9BACT|nr:MULTISPECIES: GNAT family N-acetyltransferase [Rhodonellum]SDZ20870.1 Protein N-acetyltransferase, RimJ/RimL family [Rhodonellum ikkaensis]
MDPYIFTSQRLGFRGYLPKDLDEIASMNADPEVMRFFEKPLSIKESEEFIQRQNDHLGLFGFCFFVAEALANQELIGIIGLGNRTYESPMSPFIDVGWRLKKSAWGKGFATEGAKACLDFGFKKGIQEIFAITPLINHPSENVMVKLGMDKVGTFIYPFLPADHRLNPHLYYRIQNPNKF